MLFVIQYEFVPENRDMAQARFRETGAQPPDGVKMIGRWHAAAGGEGMMVCESDDAIAIGLWMQQWTDLLAFHVTPVYDDEGAMKVLGA